MLNIPPFETDLHSHTLFSPCGLHTIIEILTAAKAAGLKGLAITDHGISVGGRTNSVFFERLHHPVPGIRLFKGVEANVLGHDGAIDVVDRYRKLLLFYQKEGFSPEARWVSDRLKTIQGENQGRFPPK